MRKAIIVEGAVKPAGHYSHAVDRERLRLRLRPGPADPAKNVVPDGFADQVRQTMRNLQIILQGAGADLGDVVKVNTYLSDVHPLPRVQRASTRSSSRPRPPARTTVGCQLVGIQVEIDCVAVLPADGGGGLMRIEDLDTPVPVIDLDRVEHNLTKMQAYCDSHGLRLRPHIKTHKMPAFAHRQVELGACGITCQKLGEAEVMADAGLDDILISYPLIGAAKALRLAALARRVRMSVARGQSAGAGDAATRRRAHPASRSACWWSSTAATSAPALSPLIRRLIWRVPPLRRTGLRFDGLMTYPSTAATAGFVAEAKRRFAADRHRHFRRLRRRHAQCLACARSRRADGSAGRHLHLP